jgi:hypothetical protein
MGQAGSVDKKIVEEEQMNMFEAKEMWGWVSTHTKTVQVRVSKSCDY